MATRENWTSNEARAEFMARHGLSSARWNDDGDLVSADRAPQAIRPAAPAPQPGPAAKLAQTFAEKLRREHETRFAASHYKPRLDLPQTTDDVPKAVRARQQEAAKKGRR